MKTFNKLISLAIISMTSLVYTACSDSFFDRYPTDSMQMETYLKMIPNCKTYSSMVITIYKTLH